MSDQKVLSEMEALVRLIESYGFEIRTAEESFMLTTGEISPIVLELVDPVPLLRRITSLFNSGFFRGPAPLLGDGDIAVGDNVRRKGTKKVGRVTSLLGAVPKARVYWHQGVNFNYSVVNLDDLVKVDEPI